MGVGQPDRTALAADLVDDVLRRHLLGVYVLVEIETDEVVPLAAEGIVWVQFGPLDEHEVAWGLHGVDKGDFVVVGQAEEVVALADIAVEALLRRGFAVGIGRVRVEVALEPGVAVVRAEGKRVGQGAFGCVV